MGYKNIKTNNLTIYPYRFKTEDEFEDEYGFDWDNDIRYGWYNNDTDGMNYLFGTDLRENEEIVKKIFQRNIKYTLRENIGERYVQWGISEHMLTKNEELKFKDIYVDTNTNLVYEKLVLKFKNFH